MLAHFLERLADASPQQRREIAARLWDPQRDSAMERAMEVLHPVLNRIDWRVLDPHLARLDKQWLKTDGDDRDGWVDAPPWFAPGLDTNVGFGRLFRETTLGHARAVMAAIGVRMEADAVHALLAPFAPLGLDASLALPTAASSAATPATTSPDQAPASPVTSAPHRDAGDRALADRLVVHLHRERATSWDLPDDALQRMTRQHGSTVAAAIDALQRAIGSRDMQAEADGLAREAASAMASHSWPTVIGGPRFPGTAVPMPIVLEAMIAVQACLMRSAMPREAFAECIAPFAAWYTAEQRATDASIEE